MQISVTGKHINVGAALKEYIEVELDNIVTKYFEQAISATVVITKEKHLFVTGIVVNEGTANHIWIKASAKDDDPHASFDLAAARVGKQLRKYKDKIKDHHKVRIDKSYDFDSLEATKYVISPEQSSGANQSDDEALIIAEKSIQIESLTVSDAVMRMDLGELPAYMFINKKTNAVNVIYRRVDGNISWIQSDIEGGIKAA